VLLVSVVDDEPEKVRALDAGADDYLTKPFGVAELLARVRALLRRAERGRSDDPTIERGPLRIDLQQHEVTVAGERVPLTPTEYRLLTELARADGRPLTHRTLLRTVWGPAYESESQILRVNVARLRDKLEARGVARGTIETITGVGYRMAEVEPAGRTGP
jgi:two-component system KDP operon response regulator KdpE